MTIGFIIWDKHWKGSGERAVGELEDEQRKATIAFTA